MSWREGVGEDWYATAYRLAHARGVEEAIRQSGIAREEMLAQIRASGVTTEENGVKITRYAAVAEPSGQSLGASEKPGNSSLAEDNLPARGVVPRIPELKPLRYSAMTNPRLVEEHQAGGFTTQEDNRRNAGRTPRSR